ncbi:MAG TPA: hypothetical protein DCQ98_12795 [Planctomycetaceae bacterium]|nr:hypothetical protein [Planctomycetaceae bacterium]HRE98911.1 hypothetical protein [Pirellulaceae bacterium]
MSERQRELRRRRHRRVKLQKLASRAAKASSSEKAVLAAKLRGLTPGAEDLIIRWGLEDR